MTRRARARSWTRVACASLTLALCLGACGKSESGSSSTSTESGGSGGTGGSGGADGGSAGSGGSNGTTGSDPESTMCDGTLCEGLSLGIDGGPQTDACCPEDSPDEPCGVKTDFLKEYDVDLERSCQPLNSPGELDPSCPDSPDIMADVLSLPGFPGCCLPSGKCGFLLDKAFNVIELNLGCIDSRELPNPDFQDPPDCDPGNPGLGGAGGSP